MKKVFLVVVLAIASVPFMSAQDNKARAIGANLGGFIGFSYQHGLSNGNMIDLAASFVPYGLGIGVQACYDWVNPFNTQIPWNEKGEWNWAMGVGLGGGLAFPGHGIIGGHIGAAGHIGVAYDFWFPLELSIDWRPEIGPAFAAAFGTSAVGFYTPGLTGITLGVRYLF